MADTPSSEQPDNVPPASDKKRTSQSYAGEIPAHSELTARPPRGRFAPSPTGPLHLGSLTMAVASFLDVKHRGGQWLLRIDDIDPPRNPPGTDQLIIQALDTHALHSDLTIQYQSTHDERYSKALGDLKERLFYCSCSRRTLRGQPIYPGTCRDHRSALADTAVRLEVDQSKVTFKDGFAGLQHVDLASQVGDFIVRRVDGLWAYHLATAVDDGLDCTHVTRGEDLLPTTPMQIYLMQLLDLPVPEYTHLPLVYATDGKKLSKQNHSPPVDLDQPAANLVQVLGFLGYEDLHETRDLTPAEILLWAIPRWRLNRVPSHNPVVQLTPETRANRAET